MSWLEAKWAYGPKNDRRGPFSKKEIQDLIESGVIAPETPVSKHNERNDYSGVNDYPAIKTELSVYFPREVYIAATKDAQMPDRYMWLGLFAQSFLLAVGYFRGWDPRNIRWAVLFSGWFWGADWFLMAGRGYKLPTRAIVYTILSGLLVNVFPSMIYFYYRNKQLKRSLTPIWLSIACFLLMAGLSYALPRPDNMDLAELNRLGNEAYNKKDYHAAVEWFSKATEQGNAQAQNWLGWMYANGRGVERDDKQAVELYRKAAEQGNVQAQTNLGWMYANGRGVEKDYTQALEWRRKAAEQGHAQAQNRLGEMYENGRGVEKDYYTAVEWYRKAAAQGNKDAEEALKRLAP